jgi:integrase/recombinase XerD
MLVTRQATIPTFAIATVEDDTQLIDLWLHNDKSPKTREEYRRDVNFFLAFLNGKPLQTVTLNDVQGYAQALELKGYAVSTQQRKIKAVKSLLSFGCRIGVLAVNVGELLKAPKGKDTLAERILTESQVLTMIALTEKQRDRVLIRFLYATGARVSELSRLKWRDVQESNQGRGQVTLFGKGNKTRAVVFSAETWKELQTLRGESGQDDPVFQSRKKKGHLDRSQIKRIIEAAGERAGVQGKVSPHWLRHSHASHSLDRNTPISLVQATLGHASVATTGRYLHARPQDSSALHLAV